MNHTDWKRQLEEELQDNILSFWLEHTLDEVNGGFISHIDQAMNKDDQSDKGLVLTARILWTFAAASRKYPNNRKYLEMADRAYTYLQSKFVDPVYGGLFWTVNYQGNPMQDKKQVYGQAFVIYALAEYFLATGREELKDQASELFYLLEKHSYDSINQGYVEALARDWRQTDDLTLSDKDLNEKKSMNTHLHVLEAYTNLYRIWPSADLKEKLKELIEVTMNHIIDPDSFHFRLFFDEEWTIKSHHISYGHDIEGSWLLVEAAEVLGDSELLSQVQHIAVQMAEAVLVKGVDEDGGIWNEADESGITDSNKDWWPQAEAMIGFYNAFQLTGDSKFEEASLRSWNFIRNYIVDQIHGEWYWSVNQQGVPLTHDPKVSVWKCPYHNGRACLEMLHRLNSNHNHHS
ncbi:N-acyl-D-glucosamine 2-epimerase [Paenibacillus anaericanus]|uniref:Cellobiose 2-epimerase n=1 Tax=Paenibacillus anaericanus TaxID=170367 RepID=A0A433Y9M2_9BACL|nr:AGE family epimerase/isomerase [Paenibacillus anaericanus]RUT46529.1 N-acyl-D-glucosamine 2-epimerase [Paenibacillus anaericanus]